jgi:hypothetical protein
MIVCIYCFRFSRHSYVNFTSHVMIKCNGICSIRTSVVMVRFHVPKAMEDDCLLGVYTEYFDTK